MDINNLNQETYLDIFATQKPEDVKPAQTSNFGSAEKEGLDIFAKPEVKEVELTEDQKKEKEEAEAAAAASGETKEVDIIGDPAKPGRKPKYAFEDATGYFADRINSGKFIKIEETAQDGTKTPFLPKTPEEFDEVIDIQVNHQLEQKKKEIETTWYETKSPAWKAVAKYAELVDNPAELLPFLQGVQTIESVADINEAEPDGAEAIIRARLQQRGESEDIITEQIALLKSGDKLIATAQKYKPLILKEEQQQLMQLSKKAELEEIAYGQMVDDIRTKAIEAIEAPIFGKQKLKVEEKSLIYDLIATPDEQSRGYKIFSEIDKLFETRDFKKLTQIALLLGKTESFMNYATIDAKNDTAAGIQRKLNAVTEGRSAGEVSEGNESRPVVQRSQYSTPRFGR